MTRILCLLVAAVSALNSALGADPVYLGCGSVRMTTSCAGCISTLPSPPTNCACVLGTCTTSQVVCTLYASAYIACDVPGTGKECYKVEATCKRRKQCNNSSGYDLGSCPDNWCDTSDETVYFGDTRMKYYSTQTTCTCQIAALPSVLGDRHSS